MRNIRIIQILLAFLFVTTTSITCIDYQSLRDRIEIVNITATENIPIIRVSVQGQEYVFLIDSGSPVSFVDSAVVVKNKLEITTVNPNELTLITGDKSIRNKSVSIMGNRFYIHNFKTTKANVRWHTGLSIDGIIGNDMIHNNRATVDVKKIIVEKLKEQI